MKNRQHILCLNIEQLSQMKQHFRGRVGWGQACRGRVGKGPSWSGAEFARCRVC